MYMRFNHSQTKGLAIALVFAGVVFLAASLYADSKQNSYAQQTRVLIESQKEKLMQAAQHISRDGADDVVSGIIQDCSLEDRERFDQLLGKLSLLRGGELSEIQKLFDACGSFFSERTAVMVMRFQREFEVYRDLVSLLAVADPKADGITYTVEEWGDLSDVQAERSALSVRLVALQGEIIDALVSGESIQSNDLQAKIVEGQQLREKLIGLSVQAETLSRSLLTL